MNKPIFFILFLSLISSILNDLPTNGYFVIQQFNNSTCTSNPNDPLDFTPPSFIKMSFNIACASLDGGNTTLLQNWDGKFLNTTTFFNSTNCTILSATPVTNSTSSSSNSTDNGNSTSSSNSTSANLTDSGNSTSSSNSTSANLTDTGNSTSSNSSSANSTDNGNSTSSSNSTSANLTDTGNSTSPNLTDTGSSPSNSTSNSTSNNSTDSASSSNSTITGTLIGPSNDTSNDTSGNSTETNGTNNFTMTFTFQCDSSCQNNTEFGNYYICSYFEIPESGTFNVSSFTDTNCTMPEAPISNHTLNITGNDTNCSPDNSDNSIQIVAYDNSTQTGILMTYINSPTCNATEAIASTMELINCDDKCYSMVNDYKKCSVVSPVLAFEPNMQNSTNSTNSTSVVCQADMGGSTNSSSSNLTMNCTTTNSTTTSTNATNGSNTTSTTSSVTTSTVFLSSAHTGNDNTFISVNMIITVLILALMS